MKNSVIYPETQNEIQILVSSLRDDGVGDDNWFPEDKVFWKMEDVQLDALSDCFERPEALVWFSKEITMAVEDGRVVDAANYKDMLLNGVSKPPIITMTKDNRVSVCDGWHRIAACMIRNDVVRAMVGREI